MSSRAVKWSPTVVINSMDSDSHIALYTNKTTLRRNMKQICMATLGFFIFVGCVCMMSVSILRAADVYQYAQTFTHPLLCNITRIQQSADLEKTALYNFTVIHSNTTIANLSNVSEICALNAEIVLMDRRDQEMLYALNVSVGSILDCFTNTECDTIFFSEQNSKYEESSKLYLFGTASGIFGGVCCAMTLLFLCYVVSKDKNSFYAEQWNTNLDGYLKYEYIIQRWSKKCRIDLCPDIDDLIYDYTDCMNVTNVETHTDSDLVGEPSETYSMTTRGSYSW